jgi:RsiW-degrading membrane proteinase PrsW (M82 family)
MSHTFAITVGAPLLILLYIIKSDRFPEPLSCILKIFFIGVFLCFPAGYLNSIFIHGSEYDLSFLAGLTEEGLKFLAFLFFVSKKFQFNERMDAIVYGVLISLGFATLENLEYVYGGVVEADQFYIAFIRALTAIPMHAMCGVIMGYHFGIRFFDHKEDHLWKAFLIPMFVHGTHNFLTQAWPLMFLFLIAVFFYIKNLHNQFMVYQIGKEKEGENKLL